MRAVVFDRDGVLTHFDFGPVLTALSDEPPSAFQSLRTCWDRWSAEHPPPRSPEDEPEYLRSFFSAACEIMGAQTSTRARLLELDYIRAFVAYPDARPALERARALGLRVGVLSNFPLVSIEASLRAAGLFDLIDVASAASSHGALKPAPEAYRRVLRALGVTASECLFIDDELPCVEGARALGIESYLLDRARSRSSSGVLHDLASFEARFTAAALGASASRAAEGASRV